MYFSDTYFKMYDVYNNAWNLGGQLNVNFDRYLVVQRGGIFSFSGDTKSPKYFKRSKMTDINLRIGAVVITFLYFKITFFESHFYRTLFSFLATEH